MVEESHDTSRHLNIACETTASGWRQPNHIHSDGFISFAFRKLIGACEMRSRTELVCCSEGLRFTGASPEAGTETTSDLSAARQSRRALILSNIGNVRNFPERP